MNKKIILGVIIIGGCTLTSLYINNNTPEANTTTNYIDFKIDDTNTTEYVNEVKNVVYLKKKTTKKKAKKKKKTTKTFKISYNKNTILEYTYQLVKSYGWNDKDYQAVFKILQRESGINPNSVNRSSGACGLFQAYPCNKTIKNGYKDYKTNWKTQVRWGLDYIKYRYKTPSKAWSFWQKHHWY